MQRNRRGTTLILTCLSVLCLSVFSALIFNGDLFFFSNQVKNNLDVIAVSKREESVGGTATNPYLIDDWFDWLYFVETSANDIFYDGGPYYGKIIADFEEMSSQGDPFDVPYHFGNPSTSRFPNFVLDGNYKRIILGYDIRDDRSYLVGVGLVGWVWKCKISNLMVGGSIYYTREYNSWNYETGIGGLLGAVNGTAEIINCHISTDIYVEIPEPSEYSHAKQSIAGIVGSASSGTVVMTDTCFCGSINVVTDSSSYFNNHIEIGDYYCDGVDGISYFKENNCYYSYKKTTGTSGYNSNGDINNPTISYRNSSNPEVLNFPNAYASYSASNSNHPFVIGDWKNEEEWNNSWDEDWGVYMKYYGYNGNPNILWLVNRDQISPLQLTSEAVNESGELIKDSEQEYELYVLEDSDPQYNAITNKISFTHFGIEGGTNVDVNAPSGYIIVDSEAKVKSGEYCVVLKCAIASGNLTFVIDVSSCENLDGTGVGTVGSVDVATIVMKITIENPITITVSITPNSQTIKFEGLDQNGSETTQIITFTTKVGKLSGKYRCCGWKDKQTDKLPDILINKTYTGTSTINIEEVEVGSTITIIPIVDLKTYSAQFK